MTDDKRCLGARMFRDVHRLGTVAMALGWRMALGPDREISEDQIDEASTLLMPYVRMTEDELQKLFVVGFTRAFVSLAMDLLRPERTLPLDQNELSERLVVAAIEALEEVIIDEAQLGPSTETLQ